MPEKEEMNLEEARKNIQEKKKVKDYEFKKEGMTRTEITPTSQETQNLGKYANNYYELIQKKILKDKDKTRIFMDDVIKHRRRVLQHRLIGDITLKNQKGQVLAELQVERMLPEHELIVQATVLNREITPYTIDSIAMELYGKLSGDGVKAITITRKPIKTDPQNSTCKSINIIITYA